MACRTKIDKDMTIEEIFSSFPQKSQKLAQAITAAGLHCVGCQAATWETLEAGMMSHGYSEDEVEGLVDELNRILEQISDPSQITLTPSAAEKYKAILADEGKEGWALRFGDKAAGCSGFEYVLDYSKTPKEDDVVFVSQGVEIHVNRGAAERLLGSEIDYIDGLHGAGFKITNPNAKSACGCGKSQSY